MNPRLISGWLTHYASEGCTPATPTSEAKRKLTFSIHAKDEVSGIEYAETCVVDDPALMAKYEPKLVPGAQITVQGEQGAYWWTKGKGDPVPAKFVRVSRVAFHHVPKRAEEAAAAA